MATIFRLTVLILLCGSISGFAIDSTRAESEIQNTIRDQAQEEYAYHWGILAYVWG